VFLGFGGERFTVGKIPRNLVEATGTAMGTTADEERDAHPFPVGDIAVFYCGVIQGAPPFGFLPILYIACGKKGRPFLKKARFFIFSSAFCTKTERENW
jgi:hypothetical protein